MKAVAMKTRLKAILVMTWQGLRKWGPLIVLAIVVPGGSLLALAILRQQHHHHHHAHGSAP
jgi:hypothetical protein